MIILKKLKADKSGDASVLESTSVSINLSEGNIENIKITTAFDLIIAEKLLQMK